MGGNLAAQSMWTDWTLWSVVVSSVAIALSQLPPLWLVFRRGRVTVEVYSQMFLQHKFGNPNVMLHMIFTNRGGRKVRIKALTLEFKNRSGNVFSVPASTYLQKQDDSSGVIFVPFNLKSGEEWGHIVTFWPQLSRQDDILIRRATAALRHDLEEKRAVVTDPKEWVAADDVYVAPFVDLFNRQFKWFADDYEVTLRAETEPKNAMDPQRFRVVIFDPDTELLKAAVTIYKFGYGGIIPDTPPPDGAFVQVNII